MPTHYATPDGFSPAECDQIMDVARHAPRQDARLVGANRDHNLRRADLVWLDCLAGAEWVMDRLIDIVRRANRDCFGFDLTEFAESPQIARYGADREGHFDWHSDIGEGPQAARRKLTMVAQLSDGGDYEGGALEVRPSAHVHEGDRRRGHVSVFPSYVLHRVTPVTQGERMSLTVWAHGPAFR